MLCSNNRFVRSRRKAPRSPEITKKSARNVRILGVLESRGHAAIPAPFDEIPPCLGHGCRHHSGRIGLYPGIGSYAAGTKRSRRDAGVASGRCVDFVRRAGVRRALHRVSTNWWSLRLSQSAFLSSSRLLMGLGHVLEHPFCTLSSRRGGSGASARVD